MRKGLLFLPMLFLFLGTAVILTGQPLNMVDKNEFYKNKQAWEANPKLPPPLYFLPWKGGETNLSSQGFFGEHTHAGPQNYYAFDFQMKAQHEVYCGRPGIVHEMSIFDGSKGGDMGNMVLVEHDDGSAAVYGHIGTNTARVKKGDKVKLGQLLCMGSNQSGHVHMAVWDKVGGKAIPFSYYDVEGGYAKDMANVVSGNPSSGAKPVIKYNPSKVSVKDIMAGAGGGGGAVNGGAGGDVAADPAQAKKYFDKAMEAASADKTSSAVKYFERAFKYGLSGPDAESAKSKLDELLADAKEWKAKADEALGSEDFDTAIRYLKRIKKTYSGTELASGAEKKIEKIESSDAFKANQDDPEAVALWEKAKKAEEEEDYYKAKTFYEKLALQFPDSKLGQKAFEAMQNLPE